MEVARPVQIIQNGKLVIFLQYLKEGVSQLRLCSIVMQNIQLCLLLFFLNARMSLFSRISPERLQHSK